MSEPVIDARRHSWMAAWSCSARSARWFTEMAALAKLPNVHVKGVDRPAMVGHPETDLERPVELTKAAQVREEWRLARSASRSAAWSARSNAEAFYRI